MRLPLATIVIAIACLASSRAHSGGFEIRDQGGAVAGNAYAGAAAIAQDATTIFYNPAGMAMLSRSEAVLSADALFPRDTFDNTGSFDISGAPITGGSGGYPDGAFVPSAYAMWAPKGAADRLRFGFAVNAPFGLKTLYDDDWVGRYQAIRSEIKTFNFNPAVSVKVFDWLSVGAGADAQWMDATLTNAIDFGGVCFAALGPVVCPALGLRPQNSDGHVRLEGNDWGFGYNGGILVHPTPNTRIGLAYRSHISFNLDGDATFKVPLDAAVLTAGGTVFRDTGLRTNVTVPETATFGLYQKLTPKLVGLFGAAWTRWSRVKELRIKFDNSLQPDAVLPADWKDSWFFSVGADYLYSDRLTLRAGIAYDQSPLPDRTRTPRLPGSDAIDLAIGAGYKPYDDVKIDFAYQLAFLREADIDLTDPTSGSLDGHYKFTAHVFSIQCRQQF